MIGDGAIKGDETVLANFSGNHLPSDVTSVSNAAWVMIQYHLDSCDRQPILKMTILSIEILGRLSKPAKPTLYTRL